MEVRPVIPRRPSYFVITLVIFACAQQSFGREFVSEGSKLISLGLDPDQIWDVNAELPLYNLTGKDQTQPAQCVDYHNVNQSMRCEFMKNTEDCAIDDGFISYLDFIFCRFPSKLIPLGLVFLFLWLVFLFVSLGVTAEDFFCPALTAISHAMKLNQNIAGVTFLAFGNGAPDIFSAIAAISNAKNGDAGLAIGALFGAGVFVTTVVAGSIAISRPFKLAERPFLRDVIFYIGAAFWTFTVLYRGYIPLAEAIGFIGLYVGYVLVVLIGRRIYGLQKLGWNRNLPATTTDTPSINNEGAVVSGYGSLNDSSHIVDSEVYPPHISANHSVKGVLETTDQLAIAAAIGLPAPIRQPSMSEVGPQGDSGLEDAIFQPLLGIIRREPVQEEKSALTKLLQALNPIDSENWKSMSVIAKIYEIFKSPIQFGLQLTVPIVDYDEDLHGWNQLLNILQLITGPIFCLGVTHGISVHIAGDLYLWALVLPVCVVLAAVVFFTSKRDKQPVYHFLFAYLGFAVSVLWIYSIANEIVNLLQMFGVVFKLSSAVLGLTLLAWGNSIGDLVSDIAIAKQGFPRMAIAACFGGPLFNMLLGIGISCTIATIRDGGHFELKSDTLQFVIAGGLAVSLISSLFFMLCTRFNATKMYGFYLYALYACFLIVALLTEYGVIHF